MKLVTFPDNENGNVLRGMQEDGDDLSQPRDIDFTVVLPDSDAVQEFGSRFYNLGLQVKAKKSGTVPELPWDVTVTVNMLPSYEDITAFEQKLEMVALPLGVGMMGGGVFRFSINREKIDEVHRLGLRSPTFLDLSFDMNGSKQF